MTLPPTRLDRRVRLAARALARHGLAHAYGHVSARMPEDAATPSLLVCAPHPMGLVPEGAAGTVVPLHGPLPDGVLGEVRIHRAIYARRPDVRAICRFQSPAVMALSAMGATPRVLHGLGAYFRPAVPLHDDPRLCRDDTLAAQVADRLGPGRAVVMRGNGAITAGADLREALSYAFFLEDAAKIDLAVRAAGGGAREYTAEEAEARDIGSGGLFGRMWEYLTAGDPEG